MRCEFSETQFAYSIIHELTNHHWIPGKAWSAPFMPTQRKELDLGYDFEIHGPVRTVFFQFKVPEKITTPRGEYWKEFWEPYYIFKIWPDNRTHQHNLLVSLANKDPHNKVYYCSPGFHTQREYSKYYRKEIISDRSIYIPCGKLHSIRGADKHDICYTMEPSRNYRMHSEEYPIEAFDITEFMLDVEEARPYENINECLSRIEEEFSISARNAETTIERFNQIANQLLMKENLNLVLFGQ